MRRIVLLSVFVFSTIQHLSAQVKGVVFDSAAETPLSNSVIGLVVKSNIADTSYTIANDKGEFTFVTVPSSNFSVIISSSGYRPVAKFIAISSPEKTVNLGTIHLSSLAKVLDAVIVHSLPITIKEDTVEYRADAFKVKENAVVEDLLKKLPGVQVDKQGNIKAQGKPVTKVRVNGKDFFGGDPKTATRELPANIIDKVQIIDDYGDQATVSGIKDGDPQKIMNIQLKKDKNSGYFGRLNIGAGSQGRYQASFNGNYFNNNQQISVFTNANNTSQSLFNFGGGGAGMGNMIRTGAETNNNIGGAGNLLNALNNRDMLLQNGNDGITTLHSFGVNYRDDLNKKVTVYGSYSYSHRNNSGDKIISQQNIFPSGIIYNNQRNSFLNTGDNHRISVNLEYNIDSFNYLKISPNLSYATSTGTSNTLFDYSTADNVKISEGYNDNKSTSSSPNASATVLFNHKFKKRGRNFSMSLNAGTSKNTTEQDTKNNTNRYISPADSVNRFLFNTQKNANHNSGIRITYSEPLSKANSLDFAFSHNLSYARNYREVYDIDPSTGKRILNGLQRDDYENNFYTTRANISLRTTQKKYNYTLGISVSPVDLGGFSLTKDSIYKPIKRVNIFPVARFAYNFSKTRSLTANYRGDAQQPGFNQLQDVRDSTNLQYQINGNPNLKPSINHNVNLFYNDFNFMTGRMLFSSLSASTIQNQIIYKTLQLDKAGKQLTIPENINGFYNLNAFYNYSKPYNNRMFVVSLNGSLNYNHNINLVDSIQSTGNNWVVSQGLTFEFNYKDWLAFSTGSTYNLNALKYNNGGANVASLQNNQYSSIDITSSVNITIPKNWILKYDFEYTINHGLTGAVGRNVAILNSSLEKQLLKKKNGIIRLQAFDLFNQNSNISRTISANSIIDSRSNRLSRYVMLSFIYGIQKFASNHPPAKTKY